MSFNELEIIKKHMHMAEIYLYNAGFPLWFNWVLNTNSKRFQNKKGKPLIISASVKLGLKNKF